MKAIAAVAVTAGIVATTSAMRAKLLHLAHAHH